MGKSKKRGTVRLEVKQKPELMEVSVRNPAGSLFYHRSEEIPANQSRSYLRYRVVCG